MPSPSDPDANYALDIIKANARLLYGRAHTYDIVIAQPSLPTQNSSLGTPKFHGIKIHALLVAYDIESQEHKGKLLRGAFSMGILKTPPKVGEAIQILHEELAKEVEGLFRGLIEQPNFEGALIGRRSLSGLGIVEASGKGKGKEGGGGGGDVDDGMDGITLRGD